MASSTYTLTYWDDSTSGSTTFYTILGGTIKYGVGISKSKKICDEEITAESNGGVVSTSKTVGTATITPPSGNYISSYLCAYYVNSDGSEADLVSWSYNHFPNIGPTLAIGYLVVTKSSSPTILGWYIITDSTKTITKTSTVDFIGSWNFYFSTNSDVLQYTTVQGYVDVWGPLIYESSTLTNCKNNTGNSTTYYSMIGSSPGPIGTLSLIGYASLLDYSNGNGGVKVVLSIQ